jgi:hypothetical protein
MKYTALITLVLLTATTAAQAHRMTKQDYRVAHWCTWSAAKVCTAWRARGGKFICPPGSMSGSCRLQRGEVR